MKISWIEFIIIVILPALAMTTFAGILYYKLYTEPERKKKKLG